MKIDIKLVTQEQLWTIPKVYPKPPFRCSSILLIPENRCHYSGYGMFSAIYLSNGDDGREVIGRSQSHDAIRFRKGEDDYDMDLLPNGRVFHVYPVEYHEGYEFSIDIPGVSDIIVTTVKK